MKTLLVFACLVAYVAAHACLITPQQRGGFPAGSLRIAGADECLKIKSSPCGGEDEAGPPTSYYDAGKKYNVVWQKNLDHYYSKDPGYWEIKIGDKSLSKVTDSDDIKTLQYYTVNVTMPDEGKMMQLTYVTHNPDAPAVFYQCADIVIKK